MPRKDASGIDTYDHSNYTAPVHAVIGMAGFVLDQFPNDVTLSLSLSLQMMKLVEKAYSLIVMDIYRWTVGAWKGMQSLVTLEGMQRRKK